uniref:C2H2-type domain-containing protein n=1 Tax=Lates calcarifer TaxID=8187 RepID=A0A4W6FUX9_LATCA
MFMILRRIASVIALCYRRCVLAASSPVLASILSSTGALVELQAPCLAGSVLALVLDYIYTGTLPYARTQQDYYSLLTAACYLQMDELHEALRAWQQTEANDADKTNGSTGTENQPYKDIITTHCITANSYSKYLPLMCSIDAFRRCDETDTCSVQSTASSPEREDHQYSANVETNDEAQMHSSSSDSCIKGRETDGCGASSVNGANGYCGKDVSTLSNDSTHCSISEHCTETGVNTGNCKQVTYLTGQDFIQNIPCTAEGHGMSRADKEVQMDQFHSAGTVKPETWQKSTEEELARTVGNRRNSSSCSSSPHPCSGAVPVIRHSNGAAMLQLAEVSPVHPYHPVSQATDNFNRAPVSRSESTDNDSNHYKVQNLHYKHKKDHTGTQGQDYQNSSDQCAILDLCYKSSTDQSDMLEDHNSSNSDYFSKQNNGHMDNGLSHITDHNDHHAHCDSFQSKTHTKHHRGDSLPQNKVCNNLIRALKYKTEFSFDDMPSKHQRLNLSDCHDVSKSAAAEELSQHQRAVVPIPLEDLDTGSDSHCEDLCHEGDTKEEHSYSGGCPAEMNRQDFHSEPFGPKTDWSPKLHRAEKNTRDTTLSRHEHEHEHDNRDMAMENKRHIADVGLPVYPTPESSLDNAPFTFERRTSLELEKMSDTKITEPQSVNNITSEPNVGQSYHGHLHYHCLPQEDAHVLHGDSHPSQPDYSDQSSDEEEAGTFASPGCTSLRQHFVTGTTDHILLLDISAKPAELLVSYKNRCDREEKGFTLCKNYTFETGIRNNDKQLRNEATSAAGAESFDETKSWVGETNLEESKSIVKDQSMPGTDNIHKSGVVEEVSNPKEGENQKSTLTVCSVPSVPDSVQASMSSTLSVFIPSTLSASVPTNISAHLSTPLHHPFQCSLCDRSFSQRGSLNRHVRSHLGVRPFPCPRCPMTFSRQYRVTEHMRVHQRCTIGNDFHKPPASSV